MNKSGIAIILLCFLAAAAVVLWERRKVIKTMEEIERMLDAAMTGSFSETTFDGGNSVCIGKGKYGGTVQTIGKATISD